ncbi:MAG: [FeFe] hydrogenase H-cluster radical SAM maturase HydE [Candidatus Omnitrophica bacterium]|nr:[FeFe] hydrogenase H-cluster radical SAM maturase HydE [Candidatus Omnitrophota bacterium]
MCYAIPGKIKSIEGRTVTVDYFGEERRALNEIQNLTVGDYIYAQGGYVVQRIAPDDAREILDVWKETFFDLQDVDVRLSRIDLDRSNLSSKTGLILDLALEGRTPKKEALEYLLGLENEAERNYLYKSANFLRQKHLKNSCCVHGILEISNFCRHGCHYCGISAHNKGVERYRMSREEIIEAVTEAVETYGFKALVLQSGEDPGYSVQELCDIVREIRTRFGVLICVSFGEVGLAGLKELYDAGARGLLMRFETSNAELYASMHPGQTLATRLEHLREAARLGYLIFTGGLIGLPGQTRKDLVEDLLLARELGAEMFSYGPFLPHPDTPLGAHPAVSEAEVLNLLAVARLVDPTNAKILITTAFETLSSNARRLGLLAGANSVMLNVTPVRYRQNYALYPNRHYRSEDIQNQIEETIELLGSLGRAPTDLSVKAG